MSLTIRHIADADTETCERTICEAFKSFHDRHQFPRDFQTLEDAVRLTGPFLNHPAIFGVVAEMNGRVIASNFPDERPIRGVESVTVAPDVQEGGIGHRLMESIIEQRQEAADIRLMQNVFNMCSLSPCARSRSMPSSALR
jgi:predicted N-acetyltransferase YhbS